MAMTLIAVTLFHVRGNEKEAMRQKLTRTLFNR